LQALRVRNNKVSRARENFFISILQETAAGLGGSRFLISVLIVQENRRNCLNFDAYSQITHLLIIRVWVLPMFCGSKK
jgi:hypothetical protein